jgi:hypothetical protein
MATGWRGRSSKRKSATAMRWERHEHFR